MSDEERDMREQLSAYLDGAHAPEEQTRVEAWLEAHPEARAELDALRRVDAHYRALPRVAPPDDFEVRLRARLKTPQVRFRRGARASSVRLWPLLAAAAVFVMLAGFLIPALVREPSAGMQLAREAPKAESGASTADEQVFYLESVTMPEPGPEPEPEPGAQRIPVPEAPPPPAASRALTREAAPPATPPAAEETPAAVALAVPAPEPPEAEISADAPGYVDAPTRPATGGRGLDGRDDGIRPYADASPPRQITFEPEPHAQKREADTAARDVPVERTQLGSGTAGGGFGSFAAGRAEIPSRSDEKSVDGRLFRFRDGVWFQDGYDGQPLARLERGSAAFGRLADANPEARAWAALEPRAVFRIGEAWYSVVPPGSERLDALGYLD